MLDDKRTSMEKAADAEDPNYEGECKHSMNPDTCISCESEFTPVVEEDKFIRRQMQMGKLDKRWFADVEIQWGCSFEAKNKEEATEFLKEQFAQDYGITLQDSEITKLEEDK